MNITAVLFALMVVVMLLMLAGAGVLAWHLKWLQPTQTGDSTLGPRSVNWLAVIAITVAVWICLA